MHSRLNFLVPLVYIYSHSGGESSVSLAAGPRKFFCSAMPYVDCTALRYHCTKVPGVDLCPDAFANGFFPPGISAADFVKLEGGSDPPQPEIAPGAGKWTPQETLLYVGGLSTLGFCLMLCVCFATLAHTLGGLCLIAHHSFVALLTVYAGCWRGLLSTDPSGGQSRSMSGRTACWSASRIS
jgi:hypothetical protein